MSLEERLNKIENNDNILNNQYNNISQDILNINNSINSIKEYGPKLDKLLNFLKVI